MNEEYIVALFSTSLDNNDNKVLSRKKLIYIYHHKLKKQYIYVDRHIDTIQYIYIYIYTHTILYTTEK